MSTTSITLKRQQLIEPDPPRRIEFLFPAESDSWLTILRIGLGLVMSLYATTLAGDWLYLFSGTGKGLASRPLFEALLSTQSQFTPRLGWLVTLGRWVGVNEAVTLYLSWGLLFVASLCLILGLCSRTAAIVAWFLHLAAANSGGPLTYGFDNFATIGLFYLMIAPLPDTWSLDARWSSHARADTHIIGFHRRLLQVHLCIVYFFSGLTKSFGSGWWNGENIWYALTLPSYAIWPVSWMAKLAPILPVIGIGVVALELSYPFLIWPRRSRYFVLTAICGLHAAIGLMMGMWLFALVMLILNLAAFGVPARLSESHNAQMARQA
jgi:hypothetical protein